MQKFKKIILLLLSVFLLVLSSCATATNESLADQPNIAGKLVFTCFDFPEIDAVRDKSGDCTLITFPDGQTMLVDAGISSTSKYICNYLKELGIEKLDYVVLTHPHSDHWGGFVSFDEGPGILDSFDVEKAIVAKFPPSRSQKFFDDLHEHNVEIIEVERGDVFNVGDVMFEVLNPGEGENLISTVITADTNNASLVFRITYKNNTALMTGDIYSRQELNLVKLFSADKKLDVQFLKIPHHGYDTSDTMKFVQAVSPEIAVAEGGIDMASFIYDRYVSVGSEVYITILDGTVTVAGDGEDFEVISTTKERDK